MTIIGEEAYRAARELLEIAGPEKGDIFVVGCSTSEVAGAGIGTFSSPELAEVLIVTISSWLALLIIAVSSRLALL
ncbi:MAG: DUF436 domain-containing protein, partial [Lachnospiraceae bacterium]|nr:DUF436 domain-containing protein [Lachnospiraceae bacterium]